MQDYTGIVEKSELAEKVKQAALQGPEGQAVTVPVGYAYHPSSGESSFAHDRVDVLSSTVRVLA